VFIGWQVVWMVGELGALFLTESGPHGSGRAKISKHY
jgi:hypothetical protein